MSLVKVWSYLNTLDQDGISQRHIAVGSQSLSGVASGQSPGPRPEIPDARAPGARPMANFDQAHPDRMGNLAYASAGTTAVGHNGETERER